MARPGIDYSDINKAALQIEQQGKAPTVDLVRAALGNTGSKSTIAPLLKQWKQERQNHRSQDEAGLPPTLLGALRNVHELLQAECTEQLAKQQEIHEQFCLVAERLAAQQRAEIGSLTTQSARLQAELSLANGRIKDLEDEVRSLTQQWRDVLAERTSLTARWEDGQAQIASLQQQLQTAQAQFEHFQQASGQQRTADRHSYESRIRQADAELEHGRSQFMQAQSRATRLEAMLGQQQASNTDLLSENAAQAAALEVTEVEKQRSAEQMRELLLTKETLRSMLEHCQFSQREEQLGRRAAEEVKDLLSAQLAQQSRMIEDQQSALLALIKPVEAPTAATNMPESTQI
ncbi:MULTISPECIES: DNA-binding protein [unclassified Undibacterium]|uniref:DNA-binding protein n=1 Tax=unclassified Undibacterium TaxID=2630295 RepID=UPI002AC97CC5|nr:MULTISPECIES: DNA-binding protein [unclassified Undibacterium]MEB0139493.1 DNA-binding protein [Undibacterium sp. CCC2.1]MEB0172398.1 DNA-binding protein [Undibacterium sp. CCC1.1]MEB0175725.1 DNA-binding protein [Undibacterium sp. CCC3.4]MEB0214513.1 DNA-binding protein [Undibacterium sp. 5I2]WPX42908.1 DNA-binding protein [Undibacterium sp. CCC3.4]